MKRSITCLVTIVALWAAPALAGTAIEWPLNGGLQSRPPQTSAQVADGGQVQWTQGIGGKALLVNGLPVTLEIPPAFVQKGALSFYCRLPAKLPERLEVLRLGGFTLTVVRRQLFWLREGHTAEQEKKAWCPRQSWPSEEQFVLIEIGWAEGQPSFLFINGLLTTRMEPAEAPATPAASLSLLAGAFTAMRLEDDETQAGARFQGVLAREDFESGAPEPWKTANKSLPGRLLEGFDGSRYAFASPVKAGGYFPLQAPFGYVRVTEEMYLCGAFYATDGKVQSCLVRTWPKLTQHPNNWLKWESDPAQWTPTAIPLLRWKVKPGWIVDAISLGSAGPAERYLAMDNVCLLRGRDTEPPSQVTGLKADVSREGVRLSWQPASDNVCVAVYRVYWANVPTLRCDASEVVSLTLQREFKHEMIPHPGKWYYAVAAVDLFGNVGKPSDTVAVDVLR